MTIRAIPRSEFDRLLPHNNPLENLMVKQVEWFSNRSGNLLGTIAKGESVGGWNYAVVERDKKGNPHIRTVMMKVFSNLKAARGDLLLSMAETEEAESVNRGAATFGLPSMPAKLSVLNPDGQHGRQSKAHSRYRRTSE
jgi:hypothetical protein